MPRNGGRFDAFTAAYGGRVSLLKGPVRIRASIILDETDSGGGPSAEGFMAIWDTGATNCVITQHVVDACALKPIGMTNVNHVGGASTAETYLVDVELPNSVDVRGVRATKGQIPDADILVGMDIITQGDFSVTNADGKTTLSFRIPSVSTVDYVQAANARNPNAKSPPPIGRNDLCPCGSGRKYKKCCGAVAANRR